MLTANTILIIHVSYCRVGSGSAMLVYSTVMCRLSQSHLAVIIILKNPDLLYSVCSGRKNHCIQICQCNMQKPFLLVIGKNLDVSSEIILHRFSLLPPLIIKKILYTNLGTGYFSDLYLPRSVILILFQHDQDHHVHHHHLRCHITNHFKFLPPPPISVCFLMTI